VEHIIGFGKTIPNTIKKEEHIIYSAIGGRNSELYVGISHVDAMDVCESVWGNDYRKHLDVGKQGFITDRLRFIDRKQALSMAIRNGQLKTEATITNDQLYSEFIV